MNKTQFLNLLTIAAALSSSNVFAFPVCDGQACGVVTKKNPVVSMSIAIDNSKASEAFAKNLMQGAPLNNKDKIFTSTNFLSKAFNSDDLVALSSDFGVEGCRARNIAKVNYSDRLRIENGNCASEWKQGATLTTPLLRGAINRMSARVANEVVSANPVIRTFVEGKLSLDFSFSEIASNVTTTQQAEDVRPSYVLEVVEKKVQIPGFHLIGATSMTSEKTIIEKRIVERWPAPVAVRKVETLPEGDMSYGNRLAKTMGVGTVPFSRYRLKVEKLAAGLSNNVSLRIEERNEMLYADVTQALKGNSDGIIWGMRVPMKAHSVGFEYSNLNLKPVTYYRYYMTEQTNTILSFDNNTNRYASEIKMEF